MMAVVLSEKDIYFNDFYTVKDKRCAYLYNMKRICSVVIYGLDFNKVQY